jgi:hypothetical protein
MRALTKLAYEATGATYQERPYFLVTRGPYTAVRTLGKAYTLEGRYVNLLDPLLPVVEDLEVPAHSLAFVAEMGRLRGAPRVLAVSGRLRARSEQTAATAFLAQAPANTQGAARLWSGRRRFKGAKAFTSLGVPIPVDARIEGDTLLLRYLNHPNGVIVRVGWE